MKICPKEGCDRIVRTMGLCDYHYNYFLRHEENVRPKCSVDGCNKNIHGHGLCNKHYRRFLTTGDSTSYSYYDPNEYIDNGDDTHSIILRNKKGVYIDEAIIDTEQLGKVNNCKWHMMSMGYAATNIATNKKPIVKLLHQFLIFIPDGHVTDHIDRNKLNNRISNLRAVTQQENLCNKSIRSDNTSGVIGVSYNKDRNKWYSRLYFNENKIYSGLLPNKEDAIIHRLKSEKLYYGPLAPQKHLFQQYGIV